MSPAMDRWEEYLPAPESFRLVDEIVDYQPGQSIHTRCDFGSDLPFLGDPAPRVAPPSLVLEAIFQASSVLALGSSDRKAETARVSILTLDNTRLKASVSTKVPTDIHVRILNQQGDTYRFEGRIDFCDQNTVFTQFVAAFQTKEPSDA